MDIERYYHYALEHFRLVFGAFCKFLLGACYQDFVPAGEFGVLVENLSRTNDEMVESTQGAAGGGIPLHEFRRELPPGWSPNVPEYRMQGS